MWHIYPFGTSNELIMKGHAQSAQARYEQNGDYYSGNRSAAEHARVEWSDASYRAMIFTELVTRVRIQKKGEPVIFGLREVDLSMAALMKNPGELPDGYVSLEQFKLDYESGKLDYDIKRYAHHNIYYSVLFNISIILNFLLSGPMLRTFGEYSIEWRDVDLDGATLEQIPHLIISPSQVSKIRYNCFEVREAPRLPNIDGMEQAEGQATMDEYFASAKDLELKSVKSVLIQNFVIMLDKHRSIEEDLYVHVSPALCELYDNTNGDAQERAADEYAEWLMRAALNSPINCFEKSGSIFKKTKMTCIIPALKITVEKHSGRWGVKIPYKDLPYLYYAFNVMFADSREMQKIYLQERKGLQV